MTMEDIRKNYKGYDFTIVDATETYWEERETGEWSAIGEYGWNATDADIETAGIDHVSVSEEEKIIFVYVNDNI